LAGNACWASFAVWKSNAGSAKAIRSSGIAERIFRKPAVGTFGEVYVKAARQS
jgi:hypothetical protein